MKKQLKSFAIIMVMLVALAAARMAGSAADSCKHSWVENSFSHIGKDEKHTGKTHMVTYRCQNCPERKTVEKACQFYQSSVYYEAMGNTKHVKETYYRCFDCGYGYEKASKPAAHTYKWIKVASNVRGLLCTSCHTPYRYKVGETNYSLYDSEFSYRISVDAKKSETLKNYLPAYHAKKNPVASITYSKKGICKVTHKGNTFTVKGLKKGLCVVKIKSKSGSVNTLTVRVK